MKTELTIEQKQALAKNMRNHIEEYNKGAKIFKDAGIDVYLIQDKGYTGDRPTPFYTLSIVETQKTSY